MPDHPVHAGDPDCRQEPADRRGYQAHKKRHEDGHRYRRPVARHLDAEQGKRKQRHADDEEYDCERRQEYVERYFVRRLLTPGAFYQLYHPVEESTAGFGGQSYDKPVGEDPRPACDRAPVPPRLPDHGSTFARDRALIDGSDPLDHLPVGRDGIAGIDEECIPFLEFRGRDGFKRGPVPRLLQPFCKGFTAGSAEPLGLRLPPPFSKRLGEVGEKHREPEPEGDESDIPGRGFPRADESLDPEGRRQHAPHLNNEHDRVAHHQAGIQLRQRIEKSPAIHLPRQAKGFFQCSGRGSHALLLSGSS